MSDSEDEEHSPVCRSVNRYIKYRLIELLLQTPFGYTYIAAYISLIISILDVKKKYFKLIATFLLQKSNKLIYICSWF